MPSKQEQAPSRASAEQLAELIRDSECTVALTGAGISVPSGIPDFRTPGEGLWEKVDPMSVATIDAFHRDPRRFWEFYRPRFHALSDKRPNPAHEALAELERCGLLAAVITQNIDRLHRTAGSERVIEVHGSIATALPPAPAAPAR
jgi:NAD-dependent deacetylase